MTFLRCLRISLFVVVALTLAAPDTTAQTCTTANTVRARVAAIDQPIMLNRLGASIPSGQIFALMGDVVSKNGGAITPGNAMLRPGKRPRPMVLRVNEGDCLEIIFTNLLGGVTDPNQPTTPERSVHGLGLQWTSSNGDDGSWIGSNTNSLARPGTTRPYKLYAAHSGAYLLQSTAANWGNQTDLQAGMFGAIHIEPRGAEWYRSQVTNADLKLATSGTNPNGTPRINYDARYTSGPLAGRPILRMLDPNTREIVHSDLTAVITGPNHGRFPAGQFPPNYAEPDRSQPFREITVIYHEVFSAVQAFPQFITGDLVQTLAAGGDFFAINYGTGAIGPEILANRFGVGPMGGCVDCKFEEFFLSAWTIGDPAMIVDVPANASCNPPATNALNCQTNCSPLPSCGGSGQPACTPQQQACKNNCPANPTCTVQQGTLIGGVLTPNRKATYALYPDDPSNVYHSYLNDHVTYRIMHAGTVTHIHHQHAHQWLHSPNNTEAAYLDSQMISPGAAYTLEYVYNGSGNRNKTLGDSIFHCHFYPHFAGGMWSMWRVHDTFEPGTLMEGNKPQPGFSRALPDGEIAAGTPTPAVIPLPTLGIAPMPAMTRILPVQDSAGKTLAYRTEVDPATPNVNPGFPFFIPGFAGTRAPHPPMDFAYDGANELNGGLPRHLVLSGIISNQQQTRFDFSKDLSRMNAFQLPENGTPLEQVAFRFHEQCKHNTFTSDGAAAEYRTNGLPPAKGAPYADPALDYNNENANRNQNCTTDNRAKALPLSAKRIYRGAAFQTDLVFNKSGWHYPQSRMLALWDDVLPTIENRRAPEPLFFRVNSGEYVEFWHTNLVPDYYLVDDFQVRTPTDIIGQHIHLVKFDVTSSDGAANGFNYEDGTFSPQEVQERIKIINNCGGMLKNFSKAVCNEDPANRFKLTIQPPPSRICAASNYGCPDDWAGAQTTVQRWLADPLMNNSNVDRTMRTVFTHDHFGPSTHQQTGLYAALVIEPTGSTWRNNQTGKILGGGYDGGPTSWQAVIDNGSNSYREFLIALADFQLAYGPNSPSKPSDDPSQGWISVANAINAPLRGACPPGASQPCPTIISTPPAPVGTEVTNYRSEPLAMRVSAPVTAPPPGCAQGQANATDLSFVFRSDVARNLCAYNTQPTPNTAIGTSGFKFPLPLTTGLFGGDPYTPLLRAYENDSVQVRVIAGAHVFPHSMYFNGVRWFFEPGTPGFENNSGYRNTQSVGISEHFEYLFKMPRTAPPPTGTPASRNFADYLYMSDSASAIPGISEGMWGIMRAYRVPQPDLVALLNNPSPRQLPVPSSAAGYSCPAGLTPRTYDVVAVPIAPSLNGSPFVLNPALAGKGTGTSNVSGTYGLVYALRGQSVNGANVQPLAIRARAGECIRVNLTSAFGDSAANNIFTTLSQTEYGTKFFPSRNAGLHAQLLSYDVTTSDGMNVGFNPTQTVLPNTTNSRTYYWYSGSLAIDDNGKITGTPIEFGPIVLRPSDPLMQSPLGLAGAMVIEPGDATWSPAGSSVSADVQSVSAGNFRELVAVNQDDLLFGDFGNAFGWPASSNGVYHAINYRNETLSYRYDNSAISGTSNISAAFSNLLVGRPPATQLSAPNPTLPLRLRMVHPGGNGQQHAMQLYGHVWQEEPYVKNSSTIGVNPASQWLGSRDQHGPNDRFDILLRRAGGDFGVTGSYLFRSFFPAEFSDGFWGVVQVGAPAPADLGAAEAPLPSAAEMMLTAPEPRQPGQRKPEDFQRQARPLNEQEKPPSNDQNPSNQ